MSQSVVVVGSYAPALVSFRGPLLAAMATRGHRVVACAPHAAPEVVAALSQLGVSYYGVPFARASISPRLDFASLKTMYRQFCRDRPDVLLSFTIKPVIYGSLAARLARVPQICSMITGLGYAFGEGAELKRRLVSSAARQLYRLALSSNSHIIFQNPDDMTFFYEAGLIGNSATRVVNGSGVDLDHYSYISPITKPRFLMIARLIREKGVYEYAEAAKQLRSQYPEAQCQIAGWIDNETPQAISREDLEAWVRSGSIDYLGPMQDVRPALGNCAVFVLPSYYREGTPRTILEAMAMGRPIITTDMPGCRETVINGR